MANVSSPRRIWSNAWPILLVVVILSPLFLGNPMGWNWASRSVVASVIAAVFAGMAAVFTYFEKHESAQRQLDASKQQTAAAKEQVGLLTKLTAAQEKLGTVSEELNKKNDSVIGLQKENRELQQQSLDTLTGADSFVYVRPTGSKQIPDSFVGRLVHRGKVAVFDINVEIVETMKCDGLEKWSMGQALTSGVGNNRVQFLPSIGPMSLQSLAGQFQPTCNDAYYLLIIQMRNRAVVEQILLKKVADKWLRAIRVKDLYKDEELVEEIDEGFAQDATKVDWPDLSRLQDIAEQFKNATTNP